MTFDSSYEQLVLHKPFSLPTHRYSGLSGLRRVRAGVRLRTTFGRLGFDKYKERYLDFRSRPWSLRSSGRLLQLTASRPRWVVT